MDYFSTKSLFNLTKIKKRNKSDHSFLIINKPRQKNENNNNIKSKNKKIEENKSCENFFHKKIYNEKINLKIINIKKEKEKDISKPDNKINKNNGNYKKNYFNNSKKLKKHKSLDFNSKNSLKGLIISQKEIKDLLEKRENKTPEKISKTLIFPKDNNNSNATKKSVKYTFYIISGNNRK